MTLPATQGTFVMTESGLSYEGHPSFDDWQDIGRRLSMMTRGIQFMVGDWVRVGEELYGEMASQAIDAREWSESTVATYRWLSERVPYEVRRTDRLGVQHHMQVAKLAVHEQRRWLERAANDGGTPWTYRRLQRAIREGGQENGESSAHYLIVRTESEEACAQLMDELQRRGFICKAR